LVEVRGAIEEHRLSRPGLEPAGELKRAAGIEVADYAADVRRQIEFLQVLGGDAAEHDGRVGCETATVLQDEAEGFGPSDDDDVRRVVAMTRDERLQKTPVVVFTGVAGEVAVFDVDIPGRPQGLRQNASHARRHLDVGDQAGVVLVDHEKAPAARRLSAFGMTAERD
jgi:hypothetical protein